MGPDDAAPGKAACQVTAIEPQLAQAGDEITVNGTFDSASVIVNFPGGGSVEATVLGAQRARVTVPDSATEGDLTVTTCGVTVGPLPFRRTSFAPAIGRFDAIFDQSTGARQTPKLVTAREGHSATVVGRRFYVVGGRGIAGPLDSVEQARIDGDGSLGTFATSAVVSLATARNGHTAVVIGGYLYIVGGRGNGPLDSVERASISADGSLGPFEIVAGVNLATARHGHASVVVGDHLYVIGGFGESPLESIERAAINADGSLGPFAVVADLHLTSARHAHTAIVVGNYLYVIGGTGTPGALDTVERAPINADGTLGPFAEVAGVQLLTPRSGHTTTVLGNVLWVVGGARDSSSLSSVERAHLDERGLLQPFVTSGDTLLAARHDHTASVIGNYLYLLGGSGTSPLANLERASLNFGNSLAFPAPTGGALVFPRPAATTVVIGNYLYVIGGTMTNTNAIERATIHPDGTLSPFATVPGVTLMTPRRHHKMAVVENYLYLIGGIGVDGAPLRSVERALINVDGSLQGFTAVSSTLQAARAAHSSLVLGNYLYVLGGSGTKDAVSSIERALIGPDGSLGAFAIVPGSSMPASSVGHGNFVVRDYLYVVVGDGGYVGRATIASDGSIGGFVQVAGLSNSERYEATSTVVGSFVYVFGGQMFFGQGGNEVAGISSGGLLAAFSNTPTEVSPRYGHSALLAGHYLYLVGGLSGAGATELNVESLMLK